MDWDTILNSKKDSEFNDLAASIGGRCTRVNRASPSGRTKKRSQRWARPTSQFPAAALSSTDQQFRVQQSREGAMRLFPCSRLPFSRAGMPVSGYSLPLGRYPRARPVASGLRPHHKTIRSPPVHPSHEGFTWWKLSRSPKKRTRENVPSSCCART